MSDEPINKSRLPTPADLRIWAYLETGNSINNLQAIQQFKNAMLRDAAWRLKKAGYPIQAEWIKYETAEGKKKKYKSYFKTKPEILAAGQKVEKVMQGKTVSDYASSIANLANKAIRQAELFQDAT